MVPVTNPWTAAQDDNCAAGAGRLVRRLGGGGRGAAGAGRDRRPTPAARSASRRRFCGIVGIKPTYGRCSRWGVVAFASSLDQAGPLARTVQDCAILLGSMAGHDPKDSTSADVPVPGFRGGVPARREGSADRRAAGIPHATACRRRSRRCGSRASTGCATRAPRSSTSRCRTRNTRSPTYYIVAPAEASSNLARYDGVRFGLRADGEDLRELYETHPRRGLRRRGEAADHDRHLCAVGRLLRRLLPAGAEGPRADPARFHRGVRAGRCAADADRAVGGVRAGREDGRSDQDVSERRVHRAGQPGRRARHVGAGGPGRATACRSACRCIGRPFDEETVFAVGAALERAAGFPAHCQRSARGGAER